MKLTYRNLPFELRELKADGDTWTFSGYASTFGNVDLGGDRILPGAFDKTLAARPKRPLLWQHDIEQPIGVEQSLVVDQHGLLGTWRLIPTSRGADAYQLLKAGAVGALSIGYIPEQYSFDDDGVREIGEIDLLENSVVTLGMNEEALITAVKALAADAKAEWSAAYVNDLPDSAFALVLPGGSKDDEGKTTPRSLRKLPHHDKSGAVDVPHLRNALARAPQMSGVSDAQQAKAEAHLNRHAKANDVGQAGDDRPRGRKYGSMYGMDDVEPPEGSYEELSEDLEEAIEAALIPPGADGDVCVVATYATHVVCCVTIYPPPMTGGEVDCTYYDIPFSVGADDDEITLGTPTEVELQTVVAPLKGLGMPYDLHSTRVELNVRELVTRLRTGSDLRRKEGRAISEARRNRMAGVSGSLRTAADEIDAMLEETAPPQKPVEPPKGIDIGYELAVRRRRLAGRVELPRR